MGKYGMAWHPVWRTTDDHHVADLRCTIYADSSDSALDIARVEFESGRLQPYAEADLELDVRRAFEQDRTGETKPVVYKQASEYSAYVDAVAALREMLGFHTELALAVGVNPHIDPWKSLDRAGRQKMLLQALCDLSEDGSKPETEEVK